VAKKRKAYLWVILITFLLLIGNQIFIQYWLFEKATDANSLNIAGRQRMLSQRIGMMVLANQSNPGHWEDELDEAYTAMKQSHQDFLDPSSSIYVGDSPEIMKSFEGLTTYIDWIGDHLKSGYPAVENELLLTKLDRFLVRMDRTVGQLENRSEDRLWFISRAEVGLMILTIVVFIIEIFIISRPYIKKIIQQANLFESITWYQSHKVRGANAKIQGLVGIILDSREALTQDEMDQYLEMIFSESKKLDKLTRKVVEMSQADEQVLSN